MTGSFYYSKWQLTLGSKTRRKSLIRLPFLFSLQFAGMIEQDEPGRRCQSLSVCGHRLRLATEAPTGVSLRAAVVDLTAIPTPRPVPPQSVLLIVEN